MEGSGFGRPPLSSACVCDVRCFDIRLGFHDVAQPAHGSRSTLEDVGDPPKGDDRKHHDSEEREEGPERAERDTAQIDHQYAALAQQNNEADPDQRRQSREEQAPGADQLDVAIDVIAIGLVKERDFRLFLGVGANHADAGKVFLRPGGERAEGGLNLL